MKSGGKLHCSLQHQQALTTATGFRWLQDSSQASLLMLTFRDSVVIVQFNFCTLNGLWPTRLGHKHTCMKGALLWQLSRPNYIHTPHFHTKKECSILPYGTSCLKCTSYFC